MTGIRKCVCCGWVGGGYQPLPDYYNEMMRKYGTPPIECETLNTEEYSCPMCGAIDRDRMMISFMQKEKLCNAAEGTRILQIAPSKTISGWIEKHCPHMQYETTDLYMKDVTFKSDIQNMGGIDDEIYDLIICSHVLEHVQDDRKALGELKRILKQDGKIIFLVPIVLGRDTIDEEWGLSKEENWHRFGQGDHCRMYGRQGLLERLEEQVYVHSLGKDYFGEEIFGQCALTETSMLYILTKAKDIPLSFA